MWKSYAKKTRIIIGKIVAIAFFIAQLLHPAVIDLMPAILTSNYLSYWTHFLYSGQKVSKAPLALDTFLLFWLKTVQSSSYFGHIFIFIPKTVQSTSCIGHILADQVENCPKF
jgi:hypothetical protein